MAVDIPNVVDPHGSGLVCAGSGYHNPGCGCELTGQKVDHNGLEVKHLNRIRIGIFESGSRFKA